MSGLARVLSALEGAVEDLDEITLLQIRADLAAGAGRSRADRDLVRARRAVEKALVILREIDASPSSES